MISNEADSLRGNRAGVGSVHVVGRMKIVGIGGLMGLNVGDFMKISW